MYDTETAEFIESYWNGLGERDFNHYEESLYKKKTGEFFLYGEGGGLSRYAHACAGGGYRSGSGIVPLSLDAAKRWGERHLTVSEYEDVFGAVEE